MRIIAVGKIKDRFLSDGISEYVKRLAPYIKLTIVEIPEEKRMGNISESQIGIFKDREGERILTAIPDNAFVIALNIEGEMLTSESLAAHLCEWQMAGKGLIVVIIGGDLGLSPNVLSKAKLQLSLSRMTFTHQMVRLIFLEQIYRACKINSGEPYHK